MGSAPVLPVRVVSPPSTVPPVLPRGARGLRLVELPATGGLDEVVEMLCLLRGREAWAAMRAFLSDDARIESIAALGIVGPVETIEAMRFANAGATYTLDGFQIEPLGHEAVLLRARLQVAQAVEPDGVVVWLVTGSGGLIRRARMVATREEAEQLLETAGPDLGL